MYFDNEGAAIDLDQAIALAETQQFIKNVKPLLSNESYIAAVPTSPVLETEVRPVKIAQQQQTKPVERIAVNNNVTARVEPVKPAVQQPAQITTQKVYPAPVENTEKVVKSTPVAHPVASPSAPVTIATGVATVQAATNPVITTTAVKSTPTTNVKLAES